MPEPLTDYLPVVGRGAATWKVLHPPAAAPGARGDAPGRRAERHRRRGRTGRPAGRVPGAAGDARATRAPAARASSSARSTAARSTTSIRRSAGWRGRGAGCPASSAAPSSASSAPCSTSWRRDTKTSVETASSASSATPSASTRPTALVTAFQKSYQAVERRAAAAGGQAVRGRRQQLLRPGPIPAITHGPRAGGQHTVNEWVDIDDMERVALLYALTAVAYCTAGPRGGGVMITVTFLGVGAAVPAPGQTNCAYLIECGRRAASCSTAARRSCSSWPRSAGRPAT